MTHDFTTPEGRAAAIESLGVAAYNDAVAAFITNSTLAAVSGHKLRTVHTRFGKLIAVGNTGCAFSTMEQAKQYAAANPAKEII